MSLKTETRMEFFHLQSHLCACAVKHGHSGHTIMSVSHPHVDFHPAVGVCAAAPVGWGTQNVIE